MIAYNIHPRMHLSPHTQYTCIPASREPKKNYNKIIFIRLTMDSDSCFQVVFKLIMCLNVKSFPFY